MKLRLVVTTASGEYYKSKIDDYTEDGKERFEILLKNILSLNHFSMTTDAGELYFNPKYIESILVVEEK